MVILLLIPAANENMIELARGVIVVLIMMIV